MQGTSNFTNEQLAKLLIVKLHTLDKREQQAFATGLFPCSPQLSMQRRTASIPPLSATDLQISSCINENPSISQTINFK